MKQNKKALGRTGFEVEGIIKMIVTPLYKFSVGVTRRVRIE